MYKFEKKEKQGILKITANSEQWNNAVEKAYEANKGKFNIQGFRKGKAPRRVIEQNYGDTIFFDDAFNDIISQEYNQFLNENTDIIPVGQPKVEMNSFTVDQGLQATLTFDMLPEFKLPDFKTIKVKKGKVEITEKQIEDEIERERVSHARYVEEDKAVENGDFATIDFEGSVDGEKFEGGSANDYRIEIGSHTFIDGFEDQIVGMKKGEEKDINVTFPDNYPAENLKSKPAVFKTTLKKVEKKVLPEINDKYIADTTEYETVEEYKKAMKHNLENIEKEKVEREFEVKVLDEIAEKSNIELPASMIDHEVEHMVEDFEHRLSHQGMTMAGYLEYLGKTVDQFKEERREDAEKNIKTRLVLQKIISENKITVSEEDLNDTLAEYAARYNMSMEEFKKALTPNDFAYFENNAIMTKVINFIKSKIA